MHGKGQLWEFSLVTCKDGVGTVISQSDIPNLYRVMGLQFWPMKGKLLEYGDGLIDYLAMWECWATYGHPFNTQMLGSFLTLIATLRGAAANSNRSYNLPRSVGKPQIWLVCHPPFIGGYLLSPRLIRPTTARLMHEE